MIVLRDVADAKNREQAGQSVQELIEDCRLIAAGMTEPVTISPDEINPISSITNYFFLTVGLGLAAALTSAARWASIWPPMERICAGVAFPVFRA